MAGRAAGPPDQPGVPEPLHRDGIRPERRREPHARGAAWRPALAPRRRWDAIGVEPSATIVTRLGMGLEERLDTPMGLLSGGQRQALTVLMATIGAADPAPARRAHRGARSTERGAW